MDSNPNRIGNYVPAPSEPVAQNQELTEMLHAVKGPLAICATMPGAPEVDQPLMRDYARRFVKNGISPHEAVRAFDTWRDRNKFFPQPSELIEIAKARRSPELWRPPDALPGRRASELTRAERMEILRGKGRMGRDMVEHIERLERGGAEIIELPLARGDE